MPTDPFVPADPADRPRQQQNLPPGTALPSARRWQAVRPGDFDAAAPDLTRGRGLFGTPGPNVGFAYTLTERCEDRLVVTEHENMHDVVPVVAEIAGRRAALFGRAPAIHDVDAVVKLFGYDGSADPDFARARELLVREAGHNYYRRRAVIDSVPEALLRRSAGELDSSAYEWRRTVTEERFPELRREPTM